MTPNTIKGMMAFRGMTQRAAAAKIRDLGVDCSPEELNQTIHGDRENEDIQVAFAQVLGIPKEEIFDDEFYAVLKFRKSA